MLCPNLMTGARTAKSWNMTVKEWSSSKTEPSTRSLWTGSNAATPVNPTTLMHSSITDFETSAKHLNWISFEFREIFVRGDQRPRCQRRHFRLPGAYTTRDPANAPRHRRPRRSNRRRLHRPSWGLSTTQSQMVTNILPSTHRTVT